MMGGMKTILDSDLQGQKLTCWVVKAADIDQFEPGGKEVVVLELGEEF